MADDSDLSDLLSDAFEGEGEEEDRLAPESLMPPAKRQKRLGDSSIESIRASPPPHHLEDDGFSVAISSDTEGEVPSSPSNLKPDEDDTHEQVTTCSWTDCKAGDLGDMDQLVDHIHNEHIETRGKKYTCEWSDCSRKGMHHASAYALKSHMRSHTREKPFYCTLPECDRAFTRSDALAKHHRTVHETEALRPSDPIPKSMQAINKSSRPKLAMKASQLHLEGHLPGPTNGTTNGSDTPGWTSSFPPELGFTAEEEARGPKELWRLLRREVHWAEEEAESLKRQCEIIESLRKKEWLEKEILLDQILNNEISWHERRNEVLAGTVQLPTAEDLKAITLGPGSTPPSPQQAGQPSKSPAPVKGQPVEDQREAAAVLASLAQT